MRQVPETDIAWRVGLLSPRIRNEWKSLTRNTSLSDPAGSNAKRISSILSVRPGRIPVT